jgi:PAS domain S-box-containing protein
MRQHDDALLRELALMRPEDTGAPPRPRVDLRAVEQALREAAENAVASIDLELVAQGDAGADASVLIDLLEAADEQALAGAMLTPAPLPEIRWCRTWHLKEIVVRRRVGHRWPGHRPTSQARSRNAASSSTPGRCWTPCPTPWFVGDDRNRISYVNHAAADLLGWGRHELEGRRLTVLIPERLHEQHIAGYTRHMVTGERRLLGRPVRVPARRKDGSEVEVELLLAGLATPQGRPLFVASLRDLTGQIAVEGETSVAAALAVSAAVVGLLATWRPRPTFQTAAPAVLAAIGEGLCWQVAALWTGAERLRSLAEWSGDENRHARFLHATREQRMAVHTGLPGRVWASGEPAAIVDVVADANFPRSESAAADGLRSAIAFPVRRDGKLAAVVELFRRTLVAPHPDLLAILATIGDHLGALTAPEPLGR